MLLGPSEHAGNILAKEQARRDEGVGGPGRRVERPLLRKVGAGHEAACHLHDGGG